MPTSNDRVIATQRRRRPTRSGTVLSPELIVDTAIRLLGEHGTDGLSVRRLGRALGADPSSIYRYFRDTDDLVLGVADELIGRSMAGFRPSPDWRAALHEFGTRVHTTCLAHPHVAMITAARVTRRQNEMRAIELGLAILRSAGFPPDQAARHYHSFIDMTLGFAALDAATVALPAAAGRGDLGAWRSIYAQLPADTHPHIAASAEPLARTMAASAYPAALELLLDALAARLPPDRPFAPQRHPVRRR